MLTQLKLKTKDFVGSLNQEQAGYGLALFRILFGVLLMYEASRFTSHKIFYYSPDFYHFTYPLFSFVKAPPLVVTAILITIQKILAFMITIGFLFRFALFFHFLIFTYYFLIEKAFYLNHYYAVILFEFCLLWTNAHARFSIDKYLFKDKIILRKWHIFLLQFQIFVIYTYGAIAKINWDWLQGWPLKIWVTPNRGPEFLKPILALEWTPVFMSYAGFFIDLLIVPMLLTRRFFWPGLLTIISFHLLNSMIFKIGIFPWMMLAACLLFFRDNFFIKIFRLKRINFKTHPQQLNQMVQIFLISFIAYNLLFPLRHHLIPGTVTWTEEGHLYSWRMKLRDKHEPIARLSIIDKDTKKSYEIDTCEALYQLSCEGKIDLLQQNKSFVRALAKEKGKNPCSKLYRRQCKKMKGKPYMVYTLVQDIAKKLGQQGQNVEIYVNHQVSLNGRKTYPLIDTKVDLAQADYSYFSHNKWLTNFPSHLEVGDLKEVI